MEICKNYDHLFKLLLIGDANVGKTSILMRFSDGSYDDDYISTIGIDFKIKTIVVDGKRIKLQVWDTAGQERFKSITSSYYRGAHGIMLVYDVTDEKSFANIKGWLGYIEKFASKRVEKLLVGNKCELGTARAVPWVRAELLALDHNMKFIEISARNSINVSHAFEMLVRAVIERMKKEKQEAEEEAKHNLYPDLAARENLSTTKKVAGFFSKCNI